MLNQVASKGLVMASRRRRERARPRRRAAPAGRRRRQSMPDWAWGLLLGLAALLIGGGIFFVVSGGLSGGGSTCDKALVALETSDLSAKGFAQEDSGLAQVIDLINRGDRSGAESAFYGPVHNFTHNVDPSIREKDQQLGRQLCQAVLKIEDDLAFGASSLDVGLDAQHIRDLLRQAARAPGYSSP